MRMRGTLAGAQLLLCCTTITVAAINFAMPWESIQLNDGTVTKRY